MQAPWWEHRVGASRPGPIGALVATADLSGLRHLPGVHLQPLPQLPSAWLVIARPKNRMEKQTWLPQDAGEDATQSDKTVAADVTSWKFHRQACVCGAGRVRDELRMGSEERDNIGHKQKRIPMLSQVYANVLQRQTANHDNTKI